MYAQHTYMHTHIQNTPMLTHVRTQGQLRAQINEHNICVGTHRLTTLLHGAVLDTYGRAQTCVQANTHASLTPAPRTPPDTHTCARTHKHVPDGSGDPYTDVLGAAG